jgi:dihydrodipicolinate synthase/N-acetylneuraminate lyase
MPKDRPGTPAKGLYAALLTPRKAGAPDADIAALLDYIDRVVGAGVDGLVLFGATGEFIHFDIEERIRVSHLAIRRSRVPVLVNVSHSGLTGVLTLSESAISAGAAGLLLMPPYFYRFGEDDIDCFYRSAISAIGNQVPIYLYNLPQFTNAISANLARKLLALPPIAGIKDSGGDLPFFDSLKVLRAEQPFSLLVGNENVYFQERLSGADGAVSGIAAALPELMIALERAIAARNLDRAQHLNAKLKKFLFWLDQFPAVVAIKRTAAFRGWIKSDLAFPLSGESESNLDAFSNWLRDWLPETLSSCLNKTAK